MVGAALRLAAVVAFCVAASSAARAEGCRLALLLALDVSSSVDEAEYRLQKEGLAAALSDLDVRRALLEGDERVALAVYEWSGRRQSTVVLDWVLLADEAALQRAVDTVLAAPRSHDRFPTAMGFALGYGAGVLERAPACTRQVIDVSGDGITNDGFRPQQAYAHFPFAGVTVNGLAVLGSDPRVVHYFRGEVAHGPGAFVEVAEGYADFRRAMTLKLFRELNDMIVGALTR
ncbi:hypothetical protein AL036_11730 [Salipiger aestuarii]|uniref:Uncharacterized protein DUF1194 n=1 Tax=Salipiger aestuarii TaxID=568098 RepID=A0A327Y9W8_9RHOB|nr:DUF1194 domain-containing protein [Salipiger aestuarii]EIE52118.1 von Willebrand factor type A domain-containing protein [Citreicella sp. 357]KAA8607133.1 hypothetical protein AL036_11730 [Salipiger aestuarii]KAA8611021.1 hypothetical protein AL037_10830 [Salipiger aestuarii]KAB2542255.1 hypothetical protein AL035_07770 [Salipiger aestuarii]RAK16982.1 uncharacterized protein DUF1194 [Salipiger aestuarii]